MGGEGGGEGELVVALLEAEAYLAYAECDAEGLIRAYEKLVEAGGPRQTLDRLEDLAEGLLARLRGGVCKAGARKNSRQ